MVKQICQNKEQLDLRKEKSKLILSGIYWRLGSS